jgi:hypothetical protein
VKFRGIAEKPTKSELLEQTIRDHALAVVHVGSLKDELRLILASVSTGLREITIELTGVAYYYYHPTPNEAIRTVQLGEPSAFAWRLEEQQLSAYTQIQLDGLMALSQSISFRPYDPERDLNFPD